MNETDICTCGHTRGVHIGKATACETGRYMKLAVKPCACEGFVLSADQENMKPVLGNIDKSAAKLRDSGTSSL